MGKNAYSGLTGKVITPADPRYNELRQGWNCAIQQYPLAIVYCRNKYDVANAVIWAKCHGASFRIRNGGHSYEGYSNGDRVLVIDLSLMKGINLTGNLVAVEGGVTNSELYHAVSREGHPFPGGTCPTVGLGGLTLGGGWGLSCRKFGLLCDSLVEIELVNYLGQCIIANECCNADLFWACRGGGGGNFGVVVRMTFRVPPKVVCVTYFEFYYPNVTAEKQKQFFEIWQKWLVCASENITLITSIYHTPQEAFAIYSRGILYGTPSEAEEMLTPLISLLGCELSLEYVSFLEATTKIGEVYPSSEMFQSTGRFVVDPLTKEEISKLVDIIHEVPKGSITTGLTLYAMGKKVAKIPKERTAFFYRDANYILSLQSVWDDCRYQKINREWVESKFPILENMTAGSYVNFPYSGLEDYMKAYYGQNAAGLKWVKKKYDPCNIFCFPQSIPPQNIFCC